MISSDLRSSYLMSRFRDRYRSNWISFKLGFTTVAGKVKRQFIRPPFPDQKTTNLHLGCGSINNVNYINIDAVPAPHIHYVRSIDDLSIFKNETVDLIYACHCLEHFPHNKVPGVLRHWFSKLKLVGTLRLSVPDFDQLCQIYLENDQDIDLILSSMMGGQSNYLDFHKTIFNFESLKQLLISTGFKEVREWHPDELSEYSLDDWSNRQYLINGKSYPVSLNLEAVK